MSVNKVILVGRLGSDPQIRETNGGKKVANFSLATDDSYKDNNGNRQKKTDWHKLVVWSPLAEVCEQYLHKGDLAYFEGRLQTREYESTKDSTKHSVTEVVVRELKMLGSGGSQENQQPEQNRKAAPAKQKVMEEEIQF